MQNNNRRCINIGCESFKDVLWKSSGGRRLWAIEENRVLNNENYCQKRSNQYNSNVNRKHIDFKQDRWELIQHFLK